MRKLKSGGGWQAIRYTLKWGAEVGYVRYWKAMASKNACKTCALGMGGQQGGMRNEAGRFPEVCKKSLQAMMSDMRGRIEPDFFEKYSIAELRGLSPRELEALGRIADPLYAGPGETHFQVISWSEVLDKAAQALKASKAEQSVFYASGRSSNEAGFVMQLLARVFGTNHVNNCSYYCHQASGVGLTDSLGTSTATVALEDLETCDLLFLIGGNPASNHPRLMTSMMKLRNRGGKVIVVNPVKELGLENFKVPSNPVSMLLGTDIASTYVQPTIGGDIALMAGIAKTLIERGAIDQAFIDASTLNFEQVKTYVENLAWEEIVQQSGVNRDVIEGVATDYADANNVVFSWTMGITHHEHGADNVQWIVNLALMRGMVGKPGAGLMPIRGHSNVQGIGTIGVSPAIKDAALQGLKKLGIEPPAFKGHDTWAAIEAADREEIRFMLCLGGNVYGASPEAAFTAQAISKIDTLCYLSTTLNTGHVHGLGRHTLIFPVLARDEESQSTTQESMFNYVRLSDGGPSRYPGPKSEVEVITSIATRVLGDDGVLDWGKMADHEEIRKVIALLVPNLAEIESIGKTKQEFHIPGRVLHAPTFPTPTGKASFHAKPIPKLTPLGKDQLRLMTVRSEGQFNTVVYEEEDLYRGQERRDVLLMNPADMRRLGLVEDQRVTISNETGSMHHLLVRPYDISEGCALTYYPEANVLVSRSADPRSKTPAFKNVIVTLAAEGLAAATKPSLAQ